MSAQAIEKPFTVIMSYDGGGDIDWDAICDTYSKQGHEIVVDVPGGLVDAHGMRGLEVSGWSRDGEIEATDIAKSVSEQLFHMGASGVVAAYDDVWTSVNIVDERDARQVISCALDETAPPSMEDVLSFKMAGSHLEQVADEVYEHVSASWAARTVISDVSQYLAGDYSLDDVSSPVMDVVPDVRIACEAGSIEPASRDSGYVKANIPFPFGKDGYATGFFPESTSVSYGEAFSIDSKGRTQFSAVVDGDMFEGMQTTFAEHGVPLWHEDVPDGSGDKSVYMALDNFSLARMSMLSPRFNSGELSMEDVIAQSCDVVMSDAWCERYQTARELGLRSMYSDGISEESGAAFNALREDVQNIRSAESTTVRNESIEDMHAHATQLAVSHEMVDGLAICPVPNVRKEAVQLGFDLPSAVVDPSVAVREQAAQVLPSFVDVYGYERTLDMVSTLQNDPVDRVRESIPADFAGAVAKERHSTDFMKSVGLEDRVFVGDIGQAAIAQGKNAKSMSVRVPFDAGQGVAVAYVDKENVVGQPGSADLSAIVANSAESVKVGIAFLDSQRDALSARFGENVKTDTISLYDGSVQNIAVIDMSFGDFARGVGSARLQAFSNRATPRQVDRAADLAAVPSLPDGFGTEEPSMPQSEQQAGFGG